ncbi:MAG: Leukotoxin [Bacteroidota bacterium]|jgi:hypothetical protein
MFISSICLFRLLKSFALAAFLVFCGSNLVLAQISTTPSSYPYPAVNYIYTQNFSNLPIFSTYVSGITGKGPYFLGSLHAGLTGLFMAQTSGSNAALNFATSSGSNATAGIFCYGATNGPTRGLGSLASSAGAYVFGIRFTNNTGTVIDQFEIEFTAAQWRKGGSGKAGEWTFLYATTGSNNVLDTVTKKDTTLNFTSVQTSTGTAALNGLLTVNQQQKKDTLFNLNWKPGEHLILKWQDKDDIGNDDGMALQQLICRALSMPDNTAPTVLEVIPPSAKTYTAGDTLTLKIIFSEPCFLKSNAFNPYLVATILDSAKNMVYTKGSGTNEWHFSYIIEKGDLEKNGLRIYPQINSDTSAIRDAAFNYCNGIIAGNTRFLQVKIDAVAPAFIDTSFLHIHSCKHPVPIAPTLLGLTQTDSSETIFWKLQLAPTQGEILDLPFSKKTVGDTAYPKTLTFIPSGSYVGMDSAIIEISDGINRSFKKIIFQLDSGIVNNIIIGDQIICKGFSPTLFTGSNPQNISYQWLYKEDTAATFKQTTGNNNAYHYQSGTLLNSTLFKRIATRFSCTDTSNFINVQVKNTGLWTGVNGALWQMGSNWCGGLVPDVSTHVLVQKGSQIVISDAFLNQSNTAKTITLDSGASIVVNGALYWPSAVVGTGTIDATHGSIYIEKDSAIISPHIFSNNQIYNLDIDTKNKVQFLDSLVISNSLTIFNGILIAKHLTLLHAAQINSSGNNSQIIAPATVHKKYPLNEGQTKLLSLPFSNISSLQSFKNSIAITGKSGHSNGFDSATHEHPSVYFLDSTSIGNGSLMYKPFTKIDSSNLEPNSAIKIWLYPDITGIITETPFVVSKKQSSIVHAIAGGVLQHGPLEINFPSHPLPRYYLTGNPYPAALDISKVSSSSSVGKYYWYWDAGLGPSGNYTARAFRHPRVIEKLEGFIIKNTATTSGYLFYEERTKININDTINTTRYKQEYAHIGLQLMQENNILDRLEIMGIDSASSRFEKWDAEKINDNEIFIYTISRDSIPLCIDARPFTNNLFVPLGIQSSKTGKYKLAFTAYVVANDMVAYLHDKRLNKYQKIIQDSAYTFEISTDSTMAGEHRFEITGPPPPPIQEDPIVAIISPNPVQNQLRIYFSFREALPFEIAVHSIAGVTLLTQTFGTSKTGTASLDLQRLLPGHYFAIIKAGKHYLQKQFIKL